MTTPKQRRITERQKPPAPDDEMMIPAMSVIDPEFDQIGADDEFAKWRWPERCAE